MWSTVQGLRSMDRISGSSDVVEEWIVRRMCEKWRIERWYEGDVRANARGGDGPRQAGMWREPWGWRKWRERPGKEVRGAREAVKESGGDTYRCPIHRTSHIPIVESMPGTPSMGELGACQVPTSVAGMAYRDAVGREAGRGSTISVWSAPSCTDGRGGKGADFEKRPIGEREWRKGRLWRWIDRRERDEQYARLHGYAREARRGGRKEEASASILREAFHAREGISGSTGWVAAHPSQRDGRECRARGLTLGAQRGGGRTWRREPRDQMRNAAYVKSVSEQPGSHAGQSADYR
ncbi:hypothetical protein DFH06DRAFT_1146758 [Mycena polygramma]|nr:hypothetical protein DFH06DRAFT_1146758 [Mycena polygramma]